MKRTPSLLSLVAASVMLAGCQDAPVTAPESPRLSITNQAPVAVITNSSQKPVGWVNGKAVMRFYFRGINSYDPDGTITQYYWYPDSKCRMDPAYTEAYYMDIPEGTRCGLMLTVTDNAGAQNTKLEYFTWGL